AVDAPQWTVQAGRSAGPRLLGVRRAPGARRHRPARLQRVDVLLVAALAGLPAAAVYTVAGRFVVLGQFVNQAVSQAVQPRLAERLAVDDRAGTRALYRGATAWLVLETWPLYLLVAAYAPVYLGLFGPEYQRAGGP